MNDLNFLGICGSLRSASRNMGLLRRAAASLPEGVRLTIADISELPFYAEDRENRKAPCASLNRPESRMLWYWPVRNTTTPWLRP